MMVYITRVVLDPEICHGKPTIKGTRIMVSVILDYIEEGHNYQEIMDAFPTLTVDDIKASIRYAKDLVEGTHFDRYTQTEISS